MLILHEEKRRSEEENVDFLIDEIGCPTASIFITTLDRRFQEEFRYRTEEKQRKEHQRREFDMSELKRTNQEDLMFMKRELQRLQLMQSHNRRHQDSQPLFPPKFGFGVCILYKNPLLFKMNSPSKRIGSKPSSELIESSLKDFEKKYYGRFPTSSPTVGMK
jgi:hypothetical protein